MPRLVGFQATLTVDGALSLVLGWPRDATFTGDVETDSDHRAGVADIQDGGLKTEGRRVGGLEAKSLKAKSLRARGQYEAPRV
jgi:hypothetical protein